MGFNNMREAYALTVGDGVTKAVLVAMSFHACDSCGLTWPGMKGLAASTEYGEPRVRACVKRLVESGLLLVHRYPHGGRGLATEYIVLPAVNRTHSVPCPKCQDGMKKGASSSRVSGDEKGSSSSRVSGNTLQVSTPKPFTPGAHQQSENKQQSRARAREGQDECGRNAARESPSDPAPDRAIPADQRAKMVELGLLPPRATAEAPQDGTVET